MSFFRHLRASVGAVFEGKSLTPKEKPVTPRTAGLTDDHLEEIEVRRTVFRRQDVDVVDATS
jgi:hypothetical protein